MFCYILPRIPDHYQQVSNIVKQQFQISRMDTNISSSDGKIIKIGKQSQGHLDTIQTIVIHPNKQKGIFFTGGWDGILKVWQMSFESNYSRVTFSSCKFKMLFSFSFPDPVLSIAVSQSNLLFVGLGSGLVYGASLESEEIEFNEVAKHDAGVAFMTWVGHGMDFLLSAGLDNYLLINQLGDKGFKAADKINLSEQTVCGAFSYPFVVLCSLYKVKVINLLKLSTDSFKNYFQVANQQESKINCVAIDASAKVLAIGTLFGQGLIYSFDENCNITTNNMSSSSRSSAIVELSKRSYTHVANNRYERFPVNCVEIISCPKHTAVAFAVNKKIVVHSTSSKDEIKSFRTYKDFSHVTAFKQFRNEDIDSLIIATGNNWEEGIESVNKELPILLELKEVMINNYTKYG